MDWFAALRKCVCACFLVWGLSGCGGGTSAGGTFGSSERLTFEAWENYTDSKTPEELAGAEELFEDAVALNPGHSEAHNGLGWLNLQKAGQLETTEERKRFVEKARTSFKSAITADPENTDAWVGLAGLELADGNWEEVRIAAERALALNPDYFSTHDNIDFKDVHLVLAQALFFLGAFVDTLLTPDPGNALHHIDQVEPGYKELYHANQLSPPDLIEKIGELQGL